MSETAEPSMDDAGGMDVSATLAFTRFGETAAGFCGDVCAIPPGVLSAGVAEAVASGLSGAR